MAFVPVPHCVQARLRFIVAGIEEMVNVLHFFNADDVPIDSGVAQTIGSQIATAWDTNMAPVVSTQVELADVTVKDVSQADQPSFIVGWNTTGAAAGDMLPFQVALVATLRTISGSRGGRGRVYTGGFVEAGSDPGSKCSIAVEAAVTQFFQAIFGIEDVDGLHEGHNLLLGVASKSAHVGSDRNGAPVPPIVRPVAAVDVNRRWDTQRRRSNKVRA